MTNRAPALLPGLLIVLVALASGTAHACSVPVFRYAMERWEADLYEAVVFYRRSLSAADSAAIGRLEEARRRPSCANLRISLVDVAGELDEATRAQWEVQGTKVLPWLAVYPLRLRRSKPPVWARKLTAGTVAQLLDSPIRREIARRLLAGETCVWVVVPSGDRQRDRALMDSLRTNLGRLEKKLTLPRPVYDVTYFEPSKGVPLKIAFSTLVVSPRDPSEQVLLSMVFGRRFVADSLDGPVAIPVFGRGRALITIPAGKVIRRHIEEVCRFLTGPCACTVKQANPGVDILYPVDWDGALRASPSPQEPLPPLSGFSRFIEQDTAGAAASPDSAK